MDEKLLESGLKALESSDFAGALKIAQEIISQFPTDSEGYHLEGLTYQSEQSWENSITSFTNAIGESPYDPNLYNFRGFAYMNLGEMTKAEIDFKEAIDLEDFEPAHRNYVLWLILKDRIDEAIEYLTNRIQTKQNDSENFLMMGDLLSRAGYTENAESYFKVAKELKNNLK
jgi:tetratricopeptide (TPR) repeat protein